MRAIESAAKPGAGIKRDPELYLFTVFGTPSAKGPWGWRVNGHHLSVHFMAGDTSKIASSPTFFGTNPAEVREGPKKGLRIQAAEQDAGRRWSARWTSRSAKRRSSATSPRTTS